MNLQLAFDATEMLDRLGDQTRPEAPTLVPL
jgi:hypothetical protein